MSRKNAPPPGPGGLVIVDKPAGMTSHDVVSRMRRIAGTRRVGHAGTLDPMATGVLVLGVERATRLLGHLALTRKSYDATIRLGQATMTDDAEGEVTATADAGGVTDEEIGAAIAPLTGDIEQVPSSVSAIKVDGRRAYARVRSGEEVALAARPVTVYRFDVTGRRPGPEGTVDLDVTVDCSSGTYIRALARDLGAALGVGGHLTALRRTRVGPFDLDSARTLEALAGDPVVFPLSEAVATAFPRRDVSAEEATRLSHGGRLEPGGIAGAYGVFGPDGEVVALLEDRDGAARPLVVFAPAG
ncbi:MAG TPA: tRNA pseudouridine(55) synthase TruB [Mycobacteriales bacterium]|nr:tRNA pseudouridine synthase [Cryptosporangiaceae bacterium]MDQ1678033.1 tRNA pseudouridine55 synthase [Actinomycetota bacterium]HEV7754417.1 tRNA pseudouridine(55) synthase TruB [Mycobacteriales bacterium]